MRGRSLAEARPDLVAEWHPTRNDDLTPGQVMAGTNKKLWWKCPAGPDHEWSAAGCTRMKGHGCPYCAGQRASITNSVASIPELAAQWHPTRNGDLRPEDVVAGTGKKIWWLCPRGPDHEWQATGYSRMKGNGCPYCAGRFVSITNSLAELRPELAEQWHPTRNGDLTPADVVAGTNKKLWWKCPAGPDHEWQASGVDRMAGLGCPCCSGYKLSVTNSLAQFPELAAQWHPTRNGDLTPEQVVAGTMKKLWWLCPNGPDHGWQASGANRVKGRGCPSCAETGYHPTKPGTIYVLCGDQWGKVGISNVLAQRLATHAAAGAFGPLVAAVSFTDGTLPVRIEKALCALIAKRTGQRAAQDVHGYTESFPAVLLGEVQAELGRLLDELPADDWAPLDVAPPLPEA